MISHSVNNAFVIAAGMCLVLGACGPATAPPCNAEPTRHLAIREAIKLVAKDNGSRDVVGAPDLLVLPDGDTARFRATGGHVTMRARQGNLMSLLQNVRTLHRNRDVGSWTCAGEVITADLSPAMSVVAPIPIEYTSEIATSDGGRRSHYVSVQVQWEQR